MAKDDEMRKIEITNVPPKLRQELSNIADNLGVPRSGFLKQELRKVADSYPPDMKRQINKD